MTAERTPPSLDLSFEWLRGTLQDQGHVAEVLDGKVVTMFTVATAVLGLGVPLGLREGASVPIWISLLGLAVVPLYLVVAVLAYFAYRLLTWETLNDPVMIREDFWDLSPQEFKVQILAHLEDSYLHNERNLLRKAKLI